METTHQAITKYIDDAVEKATDKAAEKAAEKAANKAAKKVESRFRVIFKEYQSEMKQHMTDLKTFFSVELAKVAEIADFRPMEGRVREIVHEETKDMRSDIAVIKREVAEINQKLA